MSENEKQKLEEELQNLKILIDFHNNARTSIWKGREKELDEYMNDMLDYLNEIRRKLEQLK